MGYGKTVATREYLREGRYVPLWVSVPSAGPAAFWRAFCRVLAGAFPLCGDTTESLRLLGYPQDSMRLEIALEFLLALPFEENMALVIDDYHLLVDAGERGAGGGIGRLCEEMALKGEGAPRIVLLSRFAYDGERELLALRGVLGVVPREAFELTPEEISGYYAACGVALDAGQAARLHEITDGWISALYLYLVRFLHQGRLARPATIDTLLRKEVYERLPERLKNALFALFPAAEHVRPEQAAFLCRDMLETGADEEDGGSGAARDLLRELAENNVFFARDESGAYVLHALFRDFLGRRFAELPLERRRAAHRRNAEWHEAHGESLPAMEAYYAAGDMERVLDVLEGDLDYNLVTEKAPFFLDVFSSCPEEILRRHVPAMFKYILAAFSVGDVRTVAARMTWLVALAASRPDDDPEANAVRGELEFLRSLMAFNDIEAMSRHHRRAYELLGRPTRLFRPEASWTLGSPSVLFMFHRQSGALSDTVRQMHECLPYYYALGNGHGSGGEHLLEAEALYCRGEFDNAAIACYRAKAMAATHGQIGNVLCAQFLQMRLALAHGDFAAAGEQMGDMRRMIKEKRAYYLLPTADLCEGFVYAALGQVDAVPAWLRVFQAEERRLSTFAGGFYHIVHGRACLLDGRYAELIGLFSWVLESEAFARHTLGQIYIHVFMAAAYLGLGKKGEAAAACERAAALALPDRVIMPFVENYAALRPLLRPLPRVQALQKFRPDLNRIQVCGAAWENSRRSMLSRHFPLGDLPLTRREMEMALLAAKDKTYAEIAEELHLASTTVKKAFSLMFRKLGVSGRQELAALLEREGRATDPRIISKK